jgi:hypothetical protein
MLSGIASLTISEYSARSSLAMPARTNSKSDLGRLVMVTRAGPLRGFQTPTLSPIHQPSLSPETQLDCLIAQCITRVNSAPSLCHHGYLIVAVGAGPIQPELLCSTPSGARQNATGPRNRGPVSSALRQLIPAIAGSRKQRAPRKPSGLPMSAAYMRSKLGACPKWLIAPSLQRVGCWADQAPTQA